MAGGKTAQAGFSEVAMASLPRIYRLARRLANRGAEDLVQETLMRAYQRFGQLQHVEAGPAWMSAIMLNVYRDGLRRSKRSVDELAFDDVDEFSLYRKVEEEDPFPYSDSLHLDFIAQFGRDDVLTILLAMPEIYRAPLVLHYVEGYATKEIARNLGVPLGTILARLHRARKLFERELWNYADREGLLTKSHTKESVVP
jgi:RNA polymerase sigma-70 factor (ECF subfamily)